MKKKGIRIERKQIPKGNPYTLLKKERRKRAWMVTILSFLLIVLSVWTHQYLTKEKAKQEVEFMAYCKGLKFSEAACRWEYQRILNGAKTMILPMFKKP